MSVPGVLRKAPVSCTNDMVRVGFQSVLHRLALPPDCQEFSDSFACASGHVRNDIYNHLQY